MPQPCKPCFFHEKKSVALSSQFIFKEAYSDYSSQAWKPHQDNFYFGLKLSKNVALTLYFALNDQEYKSGGLSFYPGSHKKCFKHNSSNVIGFSSGIKTKDLDNFNLYTPSLVAGDLVIHHCNIVHTASKNISKKTRSNIAVRLFPINPKFDKNIQKQYIKFRSK